MTRFNDPFEALFALQRSLDARLGSDWMDSGTGGGGAFPPINIFEQGHDFVAVIELPGIERKDLEVQAKQNTIRVSGRKSIAYDDGASIHRRERIWGSFDRTLSLPIGIDPDRIRADYRDGVLTLVIPRAESEKPRTIKIS